MGNKFSLKKDYNRVLATQPRASINIPRFESLNNYEQQKTTSSFSIPTPRNTLQTKDENNNTSFILPNKHFEPSQTLIKSKPSPDIEQPKLPAITNDQIRRKSNEKQQIIAQKTTYPIRSSTPKHHQTIIGDPIVISRTALNIDNHRGQFKNYVSPSFQPVRNIVERNGQQFIVEFKERIEQRYVQCIDEKTYKKRYFEVIDCIPYRIIRPYKHRSQFMSRNDSSQNSSLSTLSSKQRLALPSIPDDQLFSQHNQPPIFNNRSTTATPTKSIDNKKLSERVNVTGKHEIQYNKVNVPSTNKTAQNTQYLSTKTLISPSPVPSSTSTTKQVADPTYKYSPYSQSGTLQSLPSVPKNLPYQYSSEQFLNQLASPQTHTSSSTSHSSHSDEEIISQINLNGYEQRDPSFGNNQNSKTVSYKINNQNNSSTSLDPFARSVSLTDHHHYRKRPIMQNYTEPMTNNAKFQPSIYSDYSPIPLIIKQPNQSQYSSNYNSTSTVYNG